MADGMKDQERIENLIQAIRESVSLEKERILAKIETKNLKDGFFSNISDYLNSLALEIQYLKISFVDVLDSFSFKLLNVLEMTFEIFLGIRESIIGLSEKGELLEPKSIQAFNKLISKFSLIGDDLTQNGKEEKNSFNTLQISMEDLIAFNKIKESNIEEFSQLLTPFRITEQNPFLFSSVTTMTINEHKEKEEQTTIAEKDTTVPSFTKDKYFDGSENQFKEFYNHCNPNIHYTHSTNGEDSKKPDFNTTDFDEPLRNLSEYLNNEMKSDFFTSTNPNESNDPDCISCSIEAMDMFNQSFSELQNMITEKTNEFLFYKKLDKKAKHRLSSTYSQLKSLFLNYLYEETIKFSEPKPQISRFFRRLRNQKKKKIKKKIKKLTKKETKCYFAEIEQFFQIRSSDFSQYLMLYGDILIIGKKLKEFDTFIENDDLSDQTQSVVQSSISSFTHNQKEISKKGDVKEEKIEHIDEFANRITYWLHTFLKTKFEFYWDTEAEKKGKFLLFDLKHIFGRKKDMMHKYFQETLVNDLVELQNFGGIGNEEKEKIERTLINDFLTVYYEEVTGEKNKEEDSKFRKIKAIRKRKIKEIKKDRKKFLDLLVLHKIMKNEDSIKKLEDLEIFRIINDKINFKEHQKMSVLKKRRTIVPLSVADSINKNAE